MSTHITHAAAAAAVARRYSITGKRVHDGTGVQSKPKRVHFGIEIITIDDDDDDKTQRSPLPLLRPAAAAATAAAAAAAPAEGAPERFRVPARGRPAAAAAAASSSADAQQDEYLARIRRRNEIRGGPDEYPVAPYSLSRSWIEAEVDEIRVGQTTADFLNIALSKTWQPSPDSEAFIARELRLLRKTPLRERADAEAVRLFSGDDRVAMPVVIPVLVHGQVPDGAKVSDVFAQLIGTVRHIITTQPAHVCLSLALELALVLRLLRLHGLVFTEINVAGLLYDRYMLLAMMLAGAHLEFDWTGASYDGKSFASIAVGTWNMTLPAQTNSDPDCSPDAFKARLMYLAGVTRVQLEMVLSNHVPVMALHAVVLEYLSLPYLPDDIPEVLCALPPPDQQQLVADDDGAGYDEYTDDHRFDYNDT